MAGSVYTDEQRAEAIALYQQVGTAEAGDRLGIPRRTVIDWASKAGVVAHVEDQQQQAARLRRWEAKRQEMRELLLDRAIDLLERLGNPGKAGDVRNLAIAVAVLIDKYRLEMGEVTARTFHEGTDDIDRRTAQLVAELRARGQAEGQPAAMAAGPAPNGSNTA